MSRTRCYFHIVFGTKYRARTIPLDKKETLYKYITGIVKNLKSDLIRINGVENHVHLLIDLNPTVALADMVKNIKQSSSKMLNQTFIFPLWEGWASEYYACSVSPAHVPMIKEYIDKQEEHHLATDYVTEVRSFVSKMGMTLYNDEP